MVLIEYNVFIHASENTKVLAAFIGLCAIVLIILTLFAIGTRRFGEWVITAGFKRTDKNPLIARLCNSATWVNNTLLTVEGNDGADGVYLCSGPGAGASPTTAAMIRDAERLLR